ncbi:hypothetical protein [Abyssalbus ytuae]|uniref:IrrE N-terminal-like domain-containing protein n=1 Tax=Abyssalbus ytuae TaxID=2926907 RepID=A0A9E7D458_9FLAO|nr:hypothetical protein [Abyssalbus ytuae]UOB18549.1 hypothetical protein MQE35_04490 [Abyssalbus ytuae]
MKKVLFICLFALTLYPAFSQNVKIDGRLKHHLDDFFEYCNKYGIEYHEKLFKLKSIAVVDTLYTAPDASTLGMLVRDKNKNPESIVINWITLLDDEILRTVAFHEFGHYFLDYKTHVCDDCNKIMAVINTSYFDIARDWEYHVKILFEESPAYADRKLIANKT